MLFTAGFCFEQVKGLYSYTTRVRDMEHIEKVSINAFHIIVMLNI